MGVAGSVALVVLVVNTILTIVAGSKYQDNIKDGVGTAYEGDCDVVDRYATALHIVINVLSSILLSASNYTMQVGCDKPTSDN